MKVFVCAALLAFATPFVLAQDKSSAKAQPVAAGRRRNDQGVGKGHGD